MLPTAKKLYTTSECSSVSTCKQMTCKHIVIFFFYLVIPARTWRGSNLGILIKFPSALCVSKIRRPFGGRHLRLKIMLLSINDFLLMICCLGGKSLFSSLPLKVNIVLPLHIPPLSFQHARFLRPPWRILSCLPAKGSHFGRESSKYN